ncbi:uncharacterized protein LOC111259873 isoform X1 [Varroa jacobsoni]|uniref:Uncharacterized protein n=1 Tax=Varroa destructor TaxID=109461 RepID=A0A7M7MBT6_VARDE|nr:uncharacterized protein LOC111251936 [Varroa destructor]XP_022687934.1 uncharacterized protein LOC111259873 isoform X1 [Varroa jacobsoni]
MCSMIEPEVSLVEAFDSHTPPHDHYHHRSCPKTFGALGVLKGRRRNSCSLQDAGRGAGSHDAEEGEVLMRPTDKTPLVVDSDAEEWTSSGSCVAYYSPTVMSSLFVVSLCFTLGGAFLLFFSENIFTVLWPSIGLVIIGSSLTVLTVMPGAGRWMVKQIQFIKSSTKMCWRNNLCREYVRDFKKNTADIIRMESNDES